MSLGIWMRIRTGWAHGADATGQGDHLDMPLSEALSNGEKINCQLPYRDIVYPALLTSIHVSPQDSHESPLHSYHSSHIRKQVLLQRRGPFPLPKGLPPLWGRWGFDAT